MRHYQRGIATSVILIIFLLAGVAIASGYFVFSQKQQKSKQINSFEDCAKYYPVMESYPEQCNTPDGKHFVQELSEEEKKKLMPPKESSSSSKPDETPNWKNYRNDEYGFELKYPENYQSIALQSTGQEKKTEVASFAIAQTNFLTVNVFKDKFEDYKLVDQPGGDSYRFEVLNKKWVIDKSREGAEYVPKKMDSVLEIYTYSTGDGPCRSNFLIIPHTTYSYVVEIVSVTCAIEVAGEFKENPEKLDQRLLLESFKFLK